MHAVHAQETGNGSPSCTWSPDLGLWLAAVARVTGSGLVGFTTLGLYNRQ